MKRNMALMALTGVLTLASCSTGGTPTPTTDTTPPSVTLSASPASVNSGGSSTLTAIATDAQSTVTKVEFLNGSTVIATDTTASDGWTASTGALTANTTFTARAYSTGGNATSNAVTVTVNTNGNPGNPGNPGTGAGIVITSPAINATLSGTNTVVNFNTNGTLTNIQCGVQGGAFTPASNVGAGAGSCAVDLTGRANGPVTLVVRGTDANGNLVSSSVTINLNNPLNNATVTFGPEMAYDSTGRINYLNYLAGGTRLIVQNNPGNAESDEIAIRYVKGTITLGVTLPAGATRTETWVSGTIDGAKNGALYYIGDLTANGNLTFDTTTLNGAQSRVLYLVTRTYFPNGSQTSTSSAFVVDNTGPQAADGDFQGASGAGNRLLRDYGAPNNNWAKGAVEIFTTNTNLIDQVYNPASGQILPAGVDKVSYFFVPEEEVPQITSVTGQDRVSKIRDLADFFRVAESAGPSRDFRTTVDSTGGAIDGEYVIFTIITDQMGNETASNSYDFLAFDNIGPSAQSVRLLDSSPLPFPSHDPARYISDYFSVSGSITDDGVGLNVPFFFSGSNALNFCGTTVSINEFIPPLTTDEFAFGPLLLDSNVIAPSDGECEVTFSGPDALGNTSTFTGQKVIFDNTDPTINIQRPLNGQQYAAGETVNFDATISDITSGINPAFTKTFWNDYVPDGVLRAERTRQNGFIAAATEFRTDPLNSNSAATPISLTGGWQALFPLTVESTSAPMNLHGLVVDKAGNATIQTRRVEVRDPSGTNVDAAQPNLGRFDVYQTSTPAIYQDPAQVVRHQWTVPNNGPVNVTEDFNIDLGVSGTYPRTTTPGRVIDEVNFFRQLDTAAWNDIVNYQLFDDPTLVVRAGSDLANRRTAITDLVPTAIDGGAFTTDAPWFLLGDTNTSSDWHRITTAIRGTGTAAYAGVSAVAGVVTDTAGLYSYIAEGQGASTIQNASTTTNPLLFNVTATATMVPGNPITTVGTYVLQGYGAAGWVNLSGAQVTYVDDGVAGDEELDLGINSLTALLDNSPALTFSKYRLVLNDGSIRYGQEFTPPTF